REREERFAAEASALGSRSRLISNLRGVAFATLVVAGIVAFVQGAFVPAGAVAVVAAFAFMALVVGHARVIAREDDRRRWARVNHDARFRVAGEWSALPVDGARVSSDPPPHTSDRDLFCLQ